MINTETKPTTKGEYWSKLSLISHVWGYTCRLVFIELIRNNRFELYMTRGQRREFTENIQLAK